MNAPDTITRAPRLFERLPELYRQRDAEQVPPGQLQAYVDALDSIFIALRDRVEAQYDDLFIETCAPWVIPYLADLVGTSHLKGDEQTLRADVARTVYHRRRKGTLGAVESQVHALSGWAVHAVELRDRLGWHQHLNHLRPDPLGPLAQGFRDPVRGGTVTLRAPAWLSFVDGPFDPFARTADLRPPVRREGEGPARAAVNLPNLGVFLWRLRDYAVPVTQPARAEVVPLAAAPGLASFAVRFEVHPNGDPVRLFNRHHYAADDEPPNLADADAVPHPMPAARLTSDAPAGRPEAYLQVRPYAGSRPGEPAGDVPGLVLHVPETPFAGLFWRFRGANLCAWETGLSAPLGQHEIVVDPDTGRVLFGVGGLAAADEADPLVNGLRLTATHGFSGPVGAQPVARQPPTADPATVVRRIHRADGPGVLADALVDVATLGVPLVVEIADSLTHDWDPGVLALASSLTIRALDGQCPTLRLASPLRLRPVSISTGTAPPQATLDVQLQGLYVTRAAGFPAASALIEQAALNRLHIDGCTLDPGGARVLDGTATGGRSEVWPALALDADYGLTDATELQDFDQVPAVRLSRCISGALAVPRGYTLALVDCIVDAGGGVAAAAPAGLAIGVEDGVGPGWGAPLDFSGITVFGRTRVEQAHGSGGIFVHALQVHDNQAGSCVRFSYLSGVADRLPEHYGCVHGTGGTGGNEPARLLFTDERFGEPGYAQLAWASDRRLREAGPNDDEMGAFGFLLNAHRWKNIGIRLREFMPVGMRALLVPVT
jgi:hypothetical protein